MNENQNRAFLYGESVFTTLRMEGDVLKDWEPHFERLCRGAEYVYGPFLEGASWVLEFRERVERELARETGTKILRITVFAEQVSRTLKLGLMRAEDLHFTVTPSVLNSEHQHMRLRTCPAIVRPPWWPADLKAGNYLETILAQKKFLTPDDDALLFLSDAGAVLESSVANIFVLRHNRLFTAPTGPNVLDGIMRRRVLTAASPLFQDCTEAFTTREQLFRADAVFASNSVRGIFLVDRIDQHSFTYPPEFLANFETLRSEVLR